MGGFRAAGQHVAETLSPWQGVRGGTHWLWRKADSLTNQRVFSLFSGVLGFFLMLSTVKLRSILAPGQCAAWIFFAKVRKREGLSGQTNLPQASVCADLSAWVIESRV